MLNAVYQAVTWGLLTAFIGFLAYGAAVAVLTLIRFYRSELRKLQRTR